MTPEQREVQHEDRKEGERGEHPRSNARETRDLLCPTCGYAIVNETSIGAVYCGPHVDSRGTVVGPAVRMRTIRDWDEFCKTDLGGNKCPECGRMNCDGGEQDCYEFRRLYSAGDSR